MPSMQEIIGSLKGAWLLARRDASGMQHFNLTIEGFWRSFAAILFIAPIFFVFASLSFDAATETELADGVANDSSADYAGTAVLLAISWIAFPLAMVPVSRALGLAHRYVTYIIVFNWTSIIAEAVLAAPVALLYLGVISIEVFRGGYGIALLLVVFYRWYIARTALETSGLVASTMVLLEFTLTIAVSKYGGMLVG
jgi:hypothetical protein